MGRSLLFLLLFAGLSDQSTVPCDATLEITPQKCDVTTKYCTEKPVYASGFYNCSDNGPLIYIPRTGYRVELSSLRCDESTKKWEAKEHYSEISADLYVRRPITEKGDLECKGSRKMSCSETRLDYSDLSFDPEKEAQDPTENIINNMVTSYNCPDGHLFFYVAKFALQPHEGLYLRASPTCKDSILTAEFSLRKKPVEISHLGSITCKKFSCLDSNDPPHTWPFLQGIKYECVGDDCPQFDWHQNQFPCEDKGHELVIHPGGDRTKIHWLKDHYFKCLSNGKISYTDSYGEKRIPTIEDKFDCLKPPPCPRLMSDPKKEYGCWKRSSCQTIDPSIIPNSHLSFFDGSCYIEEAVLKIVTSITSEKPGIELAHVTCKFGEWSAAPLERSLSNELTADSIKIDETTNFVCEGRDEFLACPEPRVDCMEDSNPGVKLHESMCSEAKIVVPAPDAATPKVKKDPKLVCPSEKELVMRKLVEGQIEKIQSIQSSMTCDRRSGKWVATEFPHLMPGANLDWKAFVICAIKECKDKFISDCTTQDACEKLEQPRYWLNAKCRYGYQLMYAKHGISKPIPIRNLHCDPEKADELKKLIAWSFEVEEEKIQANKDDNFVCQDERLYERVKRKPDILGETSPQCHPKKIDSICFYETEYCLPVTKGEREQDGNKIYEWTCEGERSLWYYNIGRKKREAITNLTCSPNDDVFWRAVKKEKNDSMKFVPPTHSNFVCLSNSITEVKDKPSAAHSQSKTTSKKKWRWPMGDGETVSIVTSLVIFALSIALFVWARRKQNLAQMESRGGEDTLKSVK